MIHEEMDNSYAKVQINPTEEKINHAGGQN